MTTLPAPTNRLAGALRPAIGYLRVSTEEQAEHGSGLAIQREAITDLATSRGYGIISVHADEGVSGKEGLDNRPGLGDAIDQLSEGATLLVYRLDRLARDLIVQEQVLAGIWTAGAAVLSCSEAEQVYCQPDHPEDPSRTLVRQVLGAVSAYERSMIALRMKRGRRRRLATTGYAGGPAPYGWDDAAEQETLRLVADMLDAQCTWRIIAFRLNNAGRMKRSGLPWTPQEVHRTYTRAGHRVRLTATG